MNIKADILFRVRIAFLSTMLVFVAIFFRISYIQWFEGDKWEESATENLLQYRTIPATRGNIYAEDKILLATSSPQYKLALDPMAVSAEMYERNIDSLCILLSQFFDDNTPAEYKRKINNARISKKRFLLLNTKLINYQEKKRMENWPIFREGSFKGGAIFEKVEERLYPFEHLAARTIGYINEKKQGVVGLELSFQELLAGKDGEAVYQKISGGDWKPVGDISGIKPQEGYDIYTTIDVSVQEMAYNALLKALEKNKAAFGCVMLMEVQTGHVKALVNLGRNEKGQYDEKYNYAIGDFGSGDPGSTFKLASMMAIFEDSNLQLKDTVETGGGSFAFYGRVLRDTKLGGYGRVTVQQAFEQSSTIGVARLAFRQFNNKPDAFVNYLYRFGFGNPLDFQLKGETKPYIKTPRDESWSGTSLPWMSVGYEMSIAPIHTLAFYNAVANDGKLIQPIIVKEVKQAHKTIQRFQAKVLHEKICSDSTLLKCRTLLEGVVQRGTAIAIRDSKYKIAGKTGTSQKIKNKRYVKEYYTSFVGYFPAEAPRYTMIVVVDSPQIDQYGADAAAPVFKEIADKIFIKDLERQQSWASLTQKDVFKINQDLPNNQVSYAKDVQTISEELAMQSVFKSGGEWLVPSSTKVSVDWNERKLNANKMPNVIGMTLRDAVYILENRGIKANYQGTGRVKTQSVSPGKDIPIDGKVTLSLE